MLRPRAPRLLRDRAAFLVVAAATVVVALVLGITVLERYDRQQTAHAEAARRAQDKLNDMELGMVNQETGLRGYALTRESSLLEPYDLGRRQVRTAESALDGLVEGRNRERVGQVESAARAWEAWAETRRQRIAAGDAAPAEDVQRGAELFQAFRAADAAADRDLDEQEARATAQARSRSSFLFYSTPAAGTSVLLLLVLLGALVFRSILRPVGELSAAARSVLRSESVKIPGRDRDDELGQLAEALAALQAEAERRIELSQAMVEVNSYVQLHEFVGPGLDRAAEVLDADEAAVVLIRGEDLHVTMRGLGSSVLPVPTSRDKDPALEALRSGEPVIGDYGDRAWDSAARSWAAERDIGPVLALPMISRGATVGALVLMRTRGRHGFDEADMQLGRLIASPLAAAVQVARIFEEKEAQSRALQVLNETAMATSGVLDPEALSRVVTEKAADLLGGHYATLCWFHPGDGLLHIVADTHPQPWSHAFEPGQGALGAAFQACTPVVVEDYARWNNAQDWAVRRDLKSVVAVPLLAKDRVVGALAVHTDVKHRFTSDDVRLLTLLAAQVAPALEAVRLYSRSGALRQ